MASKESKVYIIGAGPGDPELITVKGLKILREADCILYDFLSNQELLQYAKEACEKICVGKADGLHLKEQNQINQLLLEKAQQFEKVVRLKGGDPFIFSRGYEEMVFLKKNRIETEVIPGITSALAAGESFGIPLTIKGKISSVAILTGRKNDINAAIDAPKCDTLIYLMAVANLANVVKALYKSGRKKDTPCAFIQRATYRNSRIVYATLATIEETALENNITAPAVLLVGEVINQARKENNVNRPEEYSLSRI